MSGEMIMWRNGEITFLYRVGGIAIVEGRLLVEHDARGYCFTPGGRVEFGENAAAALAREYREEFGEDATVGRFVAAADHLFELEGDVYQELGMYFMVDFPPSSELPAREALFEGREAGRFYEWLPLDDLEAASVKPDFMAALARSVPRTPQYVVHSEITESP